ncbi:MAG: CDP-alcohol phosphatidyltransferase family protein [Planctomycetaceae bacterium]|nr:CDP-alcohol phosphatidyltransferase family protein [Planctomycetaceae bacterium]
METGGCDKKVPMNSLLAGVEKKFVVWLTPKFPKWVETWHLTMLTVAWSAGVVFSGVLAGRGNLQWLHLSSVMIFLQWFTDCFDGAIGRYKQTGLIKWGFYMDHFLDFVFMSAVVAGWTFLFEGTARTLLWFLSLGMGCLMVNAFLGFGATGQFKITYLRTGPTEVRLLFILLNTAVTIFGTGWLEKAIVYIFIAFCTGICIVIYRTQKRIWVIDMEIKRKESMKDSSRA